MPDIIHKHKHVKTKLVHVFHPKAVHSDHSSIQFLHSRKDPNNRFAQGGYVQPMINFNHKPELRITEAEFQKWRQDQYRKALEERIRVQEEQNQNEPDDDNENNFHETKSEEEEKEEEDELYKRHKANKANSSSSQRESSKHGNHNYNPDYEASNSDKTYANYPSRSRKTKKKKPSKPSPAAQMAERPRKKTHKHYGFVKQHEAEPEASNISPHIYVMDQTDVDPAYYSTLPKDQMTAASDNQDDIYSGLMSTRYTKLTADKSKLLGDINYNRKKQTKVAASQNRKTQ